MVMMTQGEIWVECHGVSERCDLLELVGRAFKNNATY